MRKYVMAASVAIGIFAGIAIWFSLAQPSKASQENPKRLILSELPPIKNCVDHIKLVKAELIMLGDTQAAALDLENTAYVGVVSVSVEQAANNGKNAIIKSGFTPDKPPLVVIAPGERATLRLGNLDGNSPIRIGAAIFSDGTEEGCGASLKTIRTVKAHNTNPRPQQ